MIKRKADRNAIVRVTVQCITVLALLTATIFSSAQKNSVSEDNTIIKPKLANISSIRWEHRIILISEPENTEEIFNELQANNVDIEDREIIWVVRDGGDITTNYDPSGQVAESFDNDVFNRYFDSDETAVVLIGKDGGVKVRTDQLDLGALFATIDVMPMRVQEIRRKKTGEDLE